MEVKLAGKWGTVCDDDFDDYDAQVTPAELRVVRVVMPEILLLSSSSLLISVSLFSFFIVVIRIKPERRCKYTPFPSLSHPAPRLPQVVCRMLGYQGDAVAHKNARFGRGSGPVWLDSLDCTGEESDLRLCKKSPPGASDCVHSEDAAVSCYGTRYYGLRFSVECSLW